LELQFQFDLVLMAFMTAVNVKAAIMFQEGDVLAIISQLK
jgi:hypothetical protein